MTDPTEPPRRRGLLAELGRRNVWRAAVVYAAAVWALSQGIAQLGPLFHAPDWAMRWFVIACAIGFPFWIAFAWFYVWTPQGFKREQAVTNDAAVTRRAGRKLDFWIIGILVVAVVLLITNTFVLHRDATSQANAADTKAALVALAKVPEQSVAVLPFANESGDPGQRYFSDGLSEELISNLTQVSGLKVIGKHSSFRFRDSQDPPAVIGAKLGVANLIEGSVRQAGKHIRIVVNLIRATDGTSVWSHSYDRPLKSVFAIQSHIGRAVAAALKVKLLAKTIVSEDKPPSGNVKAYQLMLQARAITDQYSATAFRRSAALVGQALKLDPNYAYAWGLLSGIQMNLGTYYLHGKAKQKAFSEARQAADQQAVLAPNATSTHLTRGRVLSALDDNQVGALAEFRRALGQAPNNVGAMALLAEEYGSLGQLRPAIKQYRKVIATDPLDSVTYVNLSIALAASGQMIQAEQAIGKAVALQPDSPIVNAELAVIDILRGDAAVALHDAGKERNPEFKALLLALAGQIAGNTHEADTSLHAYIAKYGKTQPYYVADLYALRKQPDKMFAWLQRAHTTNDPILSSSLLTDALVLRYKADPRFAKLCHELALPAPGQPLPGNAHPASANSTASAISAGTP